MKRYQAVLFAPDGDWVTDFRRDTIEEVIYELANKGSRWFFYPYEAVITCNRNLHSAGSSVTALRQRLVDTCPELEGYKGRTIGTVSKAMAKYYPETELVK